MRLRLPSLVLALAPLLAAGTCAPPGPQPPDQPGDCEAGGTPSVEPGTGQDAFVALADQAETKLNFGAQGGMHVWVSVKATGFGDARVDITLTATDLFSGAVLGSGSAPKVSLNQLEKQPAGTCDYHGIPLFLNAHYPKSGGLAKLEATVTASDGRTAKGEKHVWIGSAMPACVPGASPLLVPRTTYDSTMPGVPPGDLQDGQDVQAFQTGPGEPALAIGVYSQGFAASALSLHGELHDPANTDAAPLVSADAVITPYDLPPQLTDETPPRCLPSQIVQLPVTADLDGRTLALTLTGDDHHGQLSTVTRRVTVHRHLLSQP